MSWLITEINNAKHELTLTNLEGDVLKLVIPAEHAISSAAKKAYITAQTDLHDAAKALEAKIEALPPVVAVEAVVTKVEEIKEEILPSPSAPPIVQQRSHLEKIVIVQGLCMMALIIWVILKYV